MMNYLEFLFRKEDKVVCPSCKEEGIITEDVPISREKTLTMCRICGAYSRIENWRKVEE
ncbi:MAG: hypothetical protein J6K22_08145 [Spirochaetaceae bacterium]|nr:hypothetical protein [Spirochaetaceae bacterium]